MSTEPKTPAASTSTSTAPSRARRLRTRALWTIITLCLLLLSIKAIHHALQPQYQGKTAEEWFAEAKISTYPHGIYVPTNDPGVDALRAMGTNAVQYLWLEYTGQIPSDTPLMDAWKRYALSAQHEVEKARKEQQFRAQIMLCFFGPETECLIPELVSRLDSMDRETAEDAARWLGTLRQRPEVSVPALVRALKQSRSASKQSTLIWALSEFESEAQAALPLLLTLYDVSGTGTEEQIKIAAAIVRIDTAAGSPSHLDRVIDPDDMHKTTGILFALEVNRTHSNAIPALLKFSDSLTNREHANSMKQFIRQSEFFNRRTRP